MEDNDRITEQSSLYDDLDKMSVNTLLEKINNEDRKVAKAVEECIPQLTPFIELALERMKKGGRLFYIGAGTSGRLGVVDASECPPTFGVEQGRVIGIIAGGDSAIRTAVEFAEDDTEQGWKDLLAFEITERDILVGIAASGSTPYVLGAIKTARKNNILTAGITSNQNSLLASASEYPITPIVGPEFVTGSTRMKAGTAQKLILNMISTSLMIGLGHIKGNKMVDMQLSNDKLIDRGAKMVAMEINVSYEQAKSLLLNNGSVRKAVDFYRNQS